MSENVGMYEPSNPLSDAGDAPAPAAATGHESDGSRSGFLDRPLAAFIRLDWETVIWIAIFLVAIVTRFYMLGVRAMSHDESLHSLYSYNLYANGNYEHNPMMHGPFRYHVSAFIYFLFGDSDFTARIGPVLFGLGVVGMIYLLRVYIGRLGAIMAGIMVTLGPTLLFHSRYIRDDIFMAFFTLVWIYGAFRYLDTRRMRYLVIMVAGMAFGFVTMENHFIHGAIIGSFFVMLGLWQVSGRYGLFSVMAPVAIGGGAWWLLHEAGQDTFALVAMGIGLAIAAVALVMALRGRWHSVRRNAPADLAVLMLTLILPFLAAFIFVFTGGDPKTFSFAADYTKPDVIIKLAIYVALCAAASIAIGVAWFWHHGATAVDEFDAENADAEVHAIEPWRPGLAQWAMLMGFFWLVQVLFFTTFFTNTRDGLATGIVGSLGYWVAQQGVKRGNQPIYYYALVGWLYEFLPAILSICGITTVFYNVSRRLRKQTAWDPVAAGDLPPKCYGVRDADENGAVALSDCSSIGTRETFALFSIWWIFGAWLGYTVAGEKMPWLLTHMALPMSIFGGWWFGNMLRNVDWTAAWRKHTWLLVFAAPALFVLLLVMWVASTPTGTEPDLASTILQWLLIFAATAAIVFLSAYWSVRDGIKQGLRLLGAGAVVVLFLLTIRTSFILNYVNYDMATEFLVYAHASPDVKRALSEIDTISQRTVGDRNIVVAYDDQSAWPMSWYMRQYPNAKYYGNNPTTDAMAAPAIIVGPDNRSKVEPYVSRDYVKRTYRLIWWPEMDYFGLFECPELPEEGTQDPAATPASSSGCKVRWDRLWGAVADPAQRERLFNIIAFRKYKNPDDLSQWRDLAKWPFRHEFDLWVRRDLAPTIWDLNVLPSAEQSLAVDVPVIAPEQLRSVTATQVYNLLYDGLPLNAPRAVAIGPNGERVIADTGNHRIVVLDNQGEFIRAFGSFCNVADPAGATCVDPDGDGPLGTGDGQFYEPWGVAVDLDGNIYVADTWNGRIQVFDSAGKLVRKWGSFAIAEGENGDPMALFGPRALDFDLDGNLVVADAGNKRILIFTSSGDYVTQVGGGGVVAGRFDEPTGVGVDPTDGSILVADAWNQRVQRFDNNLIFQSEFKVPGWYGRDVFQKPFISVASDGSIYTTDPATSQVVVFDRNGAVKFAFGGPGTGLNQFGLPTGIAVDRAGGNVVIADGGSNRVVVVPEQK